MKKLLALFIVTIILSFKSDASLQGTWQYCGGKFNNKLSPPPAGYQQLRKYTDKTFEAFLLEDGEKDVKYESGTYALTADSCTETQTYSLQESKLLNVPMHYRYTMQNDTLILKGTLPGGALIEDYWKKVK
ncbi:hypothetical protein [Mucilaginibacter sp. UR6-11]|uniref:hypothetical protein n=1 Tax=Mucilaginibacter sp. UR6-11 TaxID=1435644 RepID=UPI001E41598D|nr:hypothetical protein [Mucilaginibacter sp. UR6-11]MCC8426040.1 hypothetical protein [Mucilaginibacter sp. UR6-11]